MLPNWLYVLIAFLIAAAAFAIGQVVPGAGMPFVIAASGFWVAFSVVRGSRAGRSCQ